MKCTCKECNGNGEIPCPECDGQGTYEGSIETITLEKTVKNYDELSEIQRDAKRVIRQAAQLKAMNPARADSYDAQLKATLFVINGQAEAAAKREAPNIGVGRIERFFRSLSRWFRGLPQMLGGLSWFSLAATVIPEFDAVEAFFHGHSRTFGAESEVAFARAVA